MSKKAIRWLHDELPKLVEAGLLPPDEAEAIARHYGPLEKEGRPSVGVLLCSILGAALIGLGIILLLAHNWQSLGRPLRVVLSFAPLMLGQALTGWVILRRGESRAWCEGSAVFLMGAVGASIALVGQTYHISGDPESFLLVWMLLSVPLVYLPGSSTAAALTWVGLTFWAAMASEYGGSGLQAAFWLLAALAGPHLWRVVRESPRSPRAAFLLWVLGGCLCVATGLTLKRAFPGAWVPAYGGLFASLYLLDRAWAPREAPLWRRPCRLIGAAGIVILCLMLTFDLGWRFASWAHYRQVWQQSGFSPAWLGQVALVLTLAGLALALLVRTLRRRQGGLLFGAAGAVVPTGYLLASVVPADLLSLILFNLYLAALGVGTLRAGLRGAELGTVNGGLIILTLMITARFFDSDLPFTLRGILFILIGAGFLAANLVARKRRRER